MFLYIAASKVGLWLSDKSVMYSYLNNSIKIIYLNLKTVLHIENKHHEIFSEDISLVMLFYLQKT